MTVEPLFAPANCDGHHGFCRVAQDRIGRRGTLRVRKGVGVMRTTFLAIGLLLGGAAHAQSASDCPVLPANSGLSWEKLDGQGYTFCKAMRDSDGRQVLAVMITDDASFRPRRANRLVEVVIDGNRTWWYRGELADTVGIEVRETLLELGSDHVAHISLRAGSEQELSQAMGLAEALRFEDVRLSVN